MPSTANRLSDMEFDEVSLVTRPANQMSKVVLFKSDGEDPMPEDTKVEEEQTLEDGLDQIDDVRKNGLLADDVAEYIDTLEKTVEQLFEAVEQGDEVEEEADEEDDILKSADPRIVEMVKAAESRAATAETIAKAERDRRREKEFLAKADEFPAIPGSSEDLASLMKSAADHLDTETFDQFLDLLGKVQAMIETGEVLDEVGKNTPGDTSVSPFSKVEAAAAKLREADPSLTDEQAIAKAVEIEPELYDSYREGS